MWGRLQDAREQANPSLYPESGAQRSGRLAENMLTDQFASCRAAFGFLHVWPSLRVPVGRARREIDHVVLDARGLHILEVKNWSGSVSLDARGEWVQTRPNGSTVCHGNVFAKHAAKVEALLDYLRRKGVEPSSSAVYGRVLLTNKNCSLSPEIARMDGVLTCASISAYLRTFEQSIMANLAARMLPSSLTGHRLDAEHVGRAPAKINSHKGVHAQQTYGSQSCPMHFYVVRSCCVLL